MTRELRSTITLLGISAVAGILAAACSGGDDNGQTNNVQTGGAGIVVLHTGGKAAGTGGKVGTGGAAATGGKASTGGTTATTVTGGSPATGGASPTGGQASIGGSAAATGGNTSVGGSSAMGGASSVGGSSAVGGSSVGGSSPAGGSSAIGGGTGTGGSGTPGGASASGGSSPVGGATATGGSSSTGGSSATANCGQYTDTPPTTFCTPAGTTIPVNNICTSSAGCQAGGITINGSNAGLSLTGTVYSADPVFQGTPFNNTGCSSGGISASDPATGTAFTGMSVTITNSGTSPVVVNILLPDIASNAGAAPPYYTTMKASVTVTASSSPQSFNLRWSDFTPSCTLPANVTFDPKKILALGLSIGGASTTYPLTVGVLISSLAFTTT